MTEEQKYNLIKDIVEAIDKIKAECVQGVIKGYVIPPLVNTLMKRYVCFSVILRLNTRFDYNNEVLTKWKNMLKADEWFISVKRKQLRVTFMGTIMTNNPLKFKHNGTDYTYHSA